MSVFSELIPSLMTETPAKGRQLAIKIASKTIAAIQPNEQIRHQLRTEYDQSSQLLIQAGHIVAIDFKRLQQRIITGNKDKGNTKISINVQPLS